MSIVARTLAAVVSGTPQPRDRGIPGVAEADRARLNCEVRRALAATVESGARPESLVALVEVDSVRVVERRQLALEYRASGCFSLARHVERAHVPRGHSLAVVVGDEVRMAIVALDLFGIEPAPEPLCAALDPKGAP